MTRVGRECSISLQTRRFRGGSHSVTNRDAAGGIAPEVRAAKNSEFGEG